MSYDQLPHCFCRVKYLVWYSHSFIFFFFFLMKYTVSGASTVVWLCLILYSNPYIFFVFNAMCFNTLLSFPPLSDITHPLLPHIMCNISIACFSCFSISFSVLLGNFRRVFLYKISLTSFFPLQVSNIGQGFPFCMHLEAQRLSQLPAVVSPPVRLT